MKLITDFLQFFNSTHIKSFSFARAPITRALYTYGLKEFQQFYQSQGTISQFIDRVQKDMKQT
ncbi:MAG: hypothetical protein ABSG57_13630 [Candidatus Bathyarchaeia archaeon]